MATFDVSIIGAGPVGLCVALAAARRGHVRVLVRPQDRSARGFRIDQAPAPFLALLIELGLHPARLGVTEVHDRRFIAWESEEPQMAPSPATVHIERPNLEAALLDLCGARGAIVFEEGRFSRDESSKELWFDASGRAAVSAARRLAPRMAPFCQSFRLPGAFTKAQGAFRLAAMPNGYIYRAGARSALTIGVVQGPEGGKISPRELPAFARYAGAEWLLAGLDADGAERAGGGIAAPQLAIGSFAPILIGDAALARDPLAAQGISNGVSTGLKALDAGTSASLPIDELCTHLQNLRRMIRACRFKQSSFWRAYDSALEQFEQQAMQVAGH